MLASPCGSIHDDDAGRFRSGSHQDRTSYTRRRYALVGASLCGWNGRSRNEFLLSLPQPKQEKPGVGFEDEAGGCCGEAPNDRFQNKSRCGKLQVGGMASYGLDFETLSKENPALVMCSITGFGQTGPYRNRPGYDIAIQGQSGLMSVTGTPSQEPQKVGVAISDIIAGLYAGNGVQAALREAEKTGVGQHVDIALLDTQMAALVNIASNYLTTGITPQRIGNTNPTIVPYQAFEASDGHFIIACGNDGQFARLATLLEKPEWAKNDRFRTNPGRVRNRETIVALLTTEFAKQPASYWVDALLGVGVPAAPVNDVGQALDDEHVRSRGMVQKVAFPNSTGGPPILTEMVGSPLKLSNTLMDDVSAPPVVGQHTDEILKDVLSMDDAEIADLKDNDVIR